MPTPENLHPAKVSHLIDRALFEEIVEDNRRVAHHKGCSPGSCDMDVLLRHDAEQRRIVDEAKSVLLANPEVAKFVAVPLPWMKCKCGDHAACTEYCSTFGCPKFGNRRKKLFGGRRQGEGRRDTDGVFKSVGVAFKSGSIRLDGKAPAFGASWAAVGDR